MSHPNPFAIVLLSARAVTARPVTQLPLWEEAQLTQDGCKHRVTGESLREQGGTLHPSPPVPAVSQTTAQAKGGRPIFLCWVQQWKWLSVRKGQRGQQTSKNCVFWSRQKAEEQGEGEWALWGAAQVCVTPRLHGRHGLPGSELLRHGSLKQQAWFLFRLLLFHWCFSIYLSDQVIKDLKRKNTNWVPQ